MSGSLLSDPYAAGASIPLGIRPVQQADPFEMAGKFASVNNAMAQNKLINQNTQNAALANKTQQYALNQQQMADLTRNIGVLAMDQNDANQTKDAYTGLIDRAVATGMDPALADKVKQMIPEGGTPQQYRTLGMSKFLGMSGLSGPEIVKMLAPGPGPVVNVGDAQRGTQVAPPLTLAGISPNSGTLTMAGEPMTNKLSPADRLQRVPVMVTAPDGTQRPGTQPAATGLDDTARPLPAMGNGKFSQAPQAPNAPPGFVASGAPLGQPEMIAANQKAFNEAQADVPQAVNRIAGLRTAYDALNLTHTGPGTGTYQKLRTMIQSLAPIAGLAPPNLSDEDSSTNYALAQKYLQDYANRTSLGSTATGIAATQHANPSTDISQGAALDVVRTNIGTERMGLAQTQLAKNPQTYLGDAGSFASKNDRRAFAADLYTPQQLTKLEAGLKGDEKAKFFRSLGIATKMGIVQLPGQAPAGQAPMTVPTQ